MSDKQFQRIFRRATVERLRADLRSGRSLKEYFESAIKIDSGCVFNSTIEIGGKPPVLKTPKKDPVSADLENAIALYQYYQLDEVQASDPRLWVYLGHIEFRYYSLVRWGLPGAYKDFKSDDAQKKAINQLLEHWFVNGNDRDLRRHAIARLWWAAHLTYAPWERDSEFFGDIRDADPYKFTRVLLSTQDIYQQVLERAMGRSHRILISVLEFLDNNPDYSKRANVRSLMKELNLLYGTKKIIALDRVGLKSLIEKTAQDVMRS